jgi:peroxiredoxin
MKNKFLFLTLVILIGIGGYLVFTHKNGGKALLSSPGGDTPQGGHPSVQAPPFELETQSGDTVSLSDFKGKVLVINFFASWCPPCKEEIKGFVNIYKRYQVEGVSIIGISLDNDSVKELSEFIEENKITYPVALATQDMMNKYGGIKTIPTTFFINKNGDIFNIHMGYISEKDLEASIKMVL